MQEKILIATEDEVRTPEILGDILVKLFGFEENIKDKYCLKCSLFLESKLKKHCSVFENKRKKIYIRSIPKHQKLIKEASFCYVKKNPYCDFSKYFPCLDEIQFSKQFFLIDKDDTPLKEIINSLKYLNDSTETGQLIISLPMIESFIDDSESLITFPKKTPKHPNDKWCGYYCEGGKNYKKVIKEKIKPSNLKDYIIKNFNDILKINCDKFSKCEIDDQTKELITLIERKGEKFLKTTDGKDYRESIVLNSLVLLLKEIFENDKDEEFLKTMKLRTNSN